MATMPSPKSPAGLIVLAAGALWLMSRRPAAAAAAGGSPRPATTQTTGQNFATPTGVAATLAQSVLQVVKGITNPKPATDPRPYADGTTDAARAAVRAGDMTYGAGAATWAAMTRTGTTFPTGQLVDQPQSQVPGWTVPSFNVISPSATASTSNSGDPYNPWPMYEADTITANPVYNPGTDAGFGRQFLDAWGI